jgi:hypothetical protein
MMESEHGSNYKLFFMTSPYCRTRQTFVGIRQAFLDENFAGVQVSSSKHRGAGPGVVEQWTCLAGAGAVVLRAWRWAECIVSGPCDFAVGWLLLSSSGAARQLTYPFLPAFWQLIQASLPISYAPALLNGVAGGGSDA